MQAAETTPTLPAPVLEPELAETYDSDSPWHVVLLDDDEHSYPYVIEMLCSIFGYTQVKAYMMAVEVDSRGRVIVATCHLELAEMRQEQIHAYGPDWRIPSCQGSMSCILEKAA